MSEGGHTSRRVPWALGVAGVAGIVALAIWADLDATAAGTLIAGVVTGGGFAVARERKRTDR